MFSALATEAARRIIGVLYLHPDIALPLRDINERLEGVVERRAAIRTLNRLVSDGVIEKSAKPGSDPVYRANHGYYIFDELHAIALKTLGGHDKLSEIVASADDITHAALFGSFAKDTASPNSDIDLLLVVEDQHTPAVFDLLGAIDRWGETLGREINSKLYSATEVESLLEDPSSFLRGILNGPLVVLKGDWNEWTNRARG